METQHWLTLAEKVHQNYADAEPDTPINLERFLTVLDVFAALHAGRASENDGGYYLGNLIGTGRFEGTMEQVLGTVPQAIERTHLFYRQKGVIYSHQAEIVTRNLIAVLRKEKFKQSLDMLLARFAEPLNNLASGNL